jgi:hypothetical protein
MAERSRVPYTVGDLRKIDGDHGEGTTVNGDGGGGGGKFEEAARRTNTEVFGNTTRKLGPAEKGRSE